MSALEYRFDLHIDAKARSIRGHQQIAFDLAPERRRMPLLLDWRPEDPAQASSALARSLRVNGLDGARLGARLVEGHLVLPHSLLKTGHNEVQLAWQARIYPSGSPLTRYRDPGDGAAYVYTLFVPADASGIFPCFDQPDLKARFALTLHVPIKWHAIGNAPVVSTERRGHTRTVRFATTEPISTYLFAFAAGPFVQLRSSDGTVHTQLWVRRSQRDRASAQAEEILRLSELALDHCTHYFRHPFPFAKYALVLIPELPYRGMEHVGATFLDETATLLSSRAGEQDRFARAQLVFHETAHQWLGDLVTMRSFDDLWIKEGFANFLAYRIAADVLRHGHSEVAFSILKYLACETDQSPGTTPLHRRLPDLAAAKSAYGHIVYGKAPALLRQWEAMLGPDRFRAGVRRFVHRHRYASADWRDLVSALAEASDTRLQDWAQRWILQAGVPVLDVALAPPDAQGRRALQFRQRAQRRRFWPLRLRVEVGHPRAHRRGFGVDLDERRVSVTLASFRDEGLPVAVNADDRAYAIIRMDACVLEAMVPRLSREQRALRRLQLWQALWQAVRDTTLAPSRFVRHALDHLGGETNEFVLRDVLAKARTAMDRLMHPPQQAACASALDAMFAERWRDASDPGLARAWLDGFIGLARSDAGLANLCSVASAPQTFARARITATDRLRAAALATIRGVPIDRRQVLSTFTPGGQRRRADFLLRAARPDERAKSALFERYLADRSLSEDWIVASLEFFNHPAHATQTLPLLAPALESLPALMRTRKIFFVNRWLASFLGGQVSVDALSCTRSFLRRRSLAPEIVLKVREASAALELAFRVRRRWTRPPGAG